MKNKNKQRVNRIYKATLFAMLFEDRNSLLELYNAINKSNYTDPGLLEINTLENAIYMSIKNDVSFIIDGRLSLYEHQSTYNPNIPLRFLFYISNLYSGITKDNNLYGTKAIELPTPEFIIFYNGEDERPEKEILKLSDLYSIRNKEFHLELKAELLNIRGNYNTTLKKACRTLREYSIFTDKIRAYAKTMSVEDAVDISIKECIQADILREFLTKNKAEARTVSIFEYDQEKHLKMERMEAWEEGRTAGIEEEKLDLIAKKIQKGKTPSQIADDLEETETTIRELMKKLPK